MILTVITSILFLAAGVILCLSGDIMISIAYFGICLLGLDVANDREELEYLRSELRRLHAAQCIDEVK